MQADQSPQTPEVSNASAADRYARQTLLPQVGPAGRARIAASRVLIVGCGALGTVMAELLVRAGVGFVRVVDRDLVELTNLQRQTLFDESDAAAGLPKAVAAARRLRALNSSVAIEPVVADVDVTNVERLMLEPTPADLVLDGTDNAATRYLINDACVKHGIPWVYAAAVGTEGRVMPVRVQRASERPGSLSPRERAGVRESVISQPSQVPPLLAPATHAAAALSGPCLRCIFPTPPDAGELATCDTVGVLGPVTSAVASFAATAAIRLLVGDDASRDRLIVLDAWAGTVRATPIEGARLDDCPCCGRREFAFLDAPRAGAAMLCGRSSVQIASPGGAVSLTQIAARLERAGRVEATEFLLRFTPSDAPGGLHLTVFADGRTIVHGTADAAAARSLVARFVGS